jgi:predicted DNA-binding transcriptional regulator YafY
MKEFDKKQEVTIKYTNWKNETDLRHIVPIKIWYGKTEWHKEEQWLLNAFDLDKQDYRDFSLKAIEAWNSIS